MAVGDKRPTPAEVLLVSADERVRRAVAEALRAEGYPLRSASSAAEARADVTREKAPCIVIYFMTHDDDGAEFLIDHRGDPRTAVIPVVLFSAGWHEPFPDPSPPMLAALIQFVEQHCDRAPRAGAGARSDVAPR